LGPVFFFFFRPMVAGGGGSHFFFSCFYTQKKVKIIFTVKATQKEAQKILLEKIPSLTLKHTFGSFSPPSWPPAPPPAPAPPIPPGWLPIFFFSLLLPLGFLRSTKRSNNRVYKIIYKRDYLNFSLKKSSFYEIFSYLEKIKYNIISI
jgi:hypothetical protein